MKVRLLVSRAGPNGAEDRGDVIDVDKDEMKRMMEAQPPQCEPVTGSARSKGEKRG